jgi:hypothetical protein
MGSRAARAQGRAMGSSHRRISVARLAAMTMALAVAATPFTGDVEGAVKKPFAARSSQVLSPGVKYSVGVMKTTGGRRQSVRVVEIDGSLPQAQIKALLSNDKAVRREKATQNARRKSQPGFMAMAAINGEAVKRNAQGAYAAPLSMHISGGELMVAGPCARPVIGIDGSGEARIGKVRVHLEIDVPGHSVPRTIHRVNTHRNDAKVVLFTNRFASSTRTTDGGIEAVVQLSHTLRPNDSQELRVLNVRRGPGNTQLKPGQAVISMKGPNNKWVKSIRVGQRLQLRTRIMAPARSDCGANVKRAPGWGSVVEALGGNHFTLRNGRNAAPPRAVYPSGTKRHPRTGVGVTPDGRVLMVTVDGRRPGYSIGVTLKEMGQLMKRLGARHAFNLDGGGSTVMSRRYTGSGDYRVANRPSDGRERPATNALAVFERTP